jgi:hypothetical protein
MCLGTVLLSGCGDNGINPDNKPAFSNMALLGEKLCVAYKSPDPVEKLDTVKVSFSYNSSKVKSIDVRATLDSEKTWIPIGTALPNSSEMAVIPWVPKDDSITFNYFGKKEGFVRIRDTVSNEYIDSDSFIIAGRVPYVLLRPSRKETFSIADTIGIFYSQNQDLSANLSVGFLFWADTGYDMETHCDTTIKLSQSLPIKHFLTNIVPSEYAEKAIMFAQPITIFIADYSSTSLILQADSITITQ